MSKTDTRTVEAKFKGGAYDGQTIWVDGAPPFLKHVVEYPNTLGEINRVDAGMYKLISHGPPLLYEIIAP